MAKKENIPNLSGDTKARIVRCDACAEKVRRMFAATVNEIMSLNLTAPDVDHGIMFSFDAESRKTQDKVTQLLRQLHSVVVTAIEKGIDIEWEEANKACDRIIKSQFKPAALNSSLMRGWNARNNDARRAFMRRVESGMNLSDRIWRDVKQLREEMEVAITISIGEGEDAGTISRRVRQYLNDPDLMFRRFQYQEKEPVLDADGNPVLDKHGKPKMQPKLDANGNPIWKKKWKKRVIDPATGKYRFIDYDRDSYVPKGAGASSRGVYKSAAKNAMRVARTETNIAYRRADHERWQDMDFVLGVRVELSRQHPKRDICDDLAGDYPKSFVFDGWHPQCFCFATPILMDADEIRKANEAFARGEEYKPKGKQIYDYPQGFKDWVLDNESKITDRNRSNPYFVDNNQAAIAKILRGEEFTPAMTAEEIAEDRIARFGEALRTKNWGDDTNAVFEMQAEWGNMSIDERLAALKASGITGLVPEDFFDETSEYVDIYKAVSKDKLLSNVDDVLANRYIGYPSTDFDHYAIFYEDGSIIYTDEYSFDESLEGMKKLPRRGLVGIMTNGGILENEYWAKDEETLKRMMHYGGFRKVVDGEIPQTLTPLEKSQLRHDARTEEQIEDIKARWQERLKQREEERKKQARAISTANNVLDVLRTRFDGLGIDASALEAAMAVGDTDTIVAETRALATAMAAKQRIIKMAANNVLAQAADYGDVFDTALRNAIDSGNLADMQAEIKDVAQQILEQRKFEQSVSDLIPNAHDLLQSYSRSEVQDTYNELKQVMDRWLKKWNYASLDTAPLAHLRNKLDFELGNPSISYTQKDILKQALLEKISIVEQKIAWEQLLQQAAALRTYKTSSSVFKNCISKIDAAIQSNDFDALKKCIDEANLQKQRLDNKRAKKNAGNALNVEYQGTADGTDITAKVNTRNMVSEDPFNKKSYTMNVVRMQGFDSPAKLVDDQEFDTLEKTYKEVFYRTVNDCMFHGKQMDSKEFASQLYKAAQYELNGPGGRVYGDGLYVAVSSWDGHKFHAVTDSRKQDAYRESRWYGDKDATIYEMTFNRQPRTIKQTELRRLWNKLTPAEQGKFGDNMNTYGCALGYDAMYCDGPCYMVIWNRSIIAVKKQ